MNSYVAIVGAAKTSRDQTPFDDPNVDIWGLNECMAWDWMKRADAVFQIHLPYLFERPDNYNDPNHWQWLQQQHSFPIYMLEKYPKIPASKKYPLQEVLQTVKPIRKYFTSTIPFMIALAILYGYKKIGLFGIEQMHGTEWAYQRDCTTYWIGKADGMGIEIYLPENCSLLKARLYGYEAEPMLISRHFLERRAKQLAKEVLEAQEETQNLGGQVQAIAELLEKDNSNGLSNQLNELLQAERDSLVRLSQLLGAQQENELYLLEYERAEQALGMKGIQGDYNKV
jgi:hypothetical protein